MKIGFVDFIADGDFFVDDCRSIDVIDVHEILPVIHDRGFRHVEVEFGFDSADDFPIDDLGFRRGGRLDLDVGIFGFKGLDRIVEPLVAESALEVTDIQISLHRFVGGNRLIHCEIAVSLASS